MLWTSLYLMLTVDSDVTCEGMLLMCYVITSCQLRYTHSNILFIYTEYTQHDCLTTQCAALISKYNIYFKVSGK